MSKTKKILIGCIASSFFISIYCAVAGNHAGLAFFNPITIFLCFALLMTTMKSLGPHKLSTFYMGLGFLCVGAGEEYHFINHYILNDTPYNDTMRIIFVSTSLFFALNETTFLTYKLKGRPRDISHLFANSFCVAILGFQLLNKLFSNASGSLTTFLQYTYMAFVFIAFYVCTMSVQTFFLVGWEHIKRGTLLTTTGMLFYEIMDIQYLYQLTLGNEPDNNIIDLMYTFFIILMTAGIVFQVERRYVFDFKTRVYNQKSSYYRLTATICGIIATLILMATGFFTGSEASGIVIILMSYLVMSYLLYNAEINEQYNKTLQEKVDAQTAKLKQQNAELEDAKAMAEKASKAKDQFLANMSHEIRTPINTILGMDELIIREADDSTIKKYAINIRRAGKALLAQVNDFLDFSRIEAGKMELFPDEYNLGLLVTDLVNMTKQRASAKGLEFTVDVDKNIPQVLYGDSVRIKQILLNLLSNAVKYTKEGGITLKISFEKLSETTLDLSATVKDTGIGIKDEDINKLFTAFERLDEIRNRTIEGTGLGMNIVMKLLELMHSKLIVESSYGEGSSFSFTVRQRVINWEPLGDYESAIEDMSVKSGAYVSPFTAPEARILLVDDTEMNLMVTKGLLKESFVNIDTAADGNQALIMTENNEYDLLLVDHRMPVMDGMEMIRFLRADLMNKNNRKPCIALTANAIQGAREEYIKAGFDDYLIKPVNSHLLEEALLKYLPKEKIHVDDPSVPEESTLNPKLAKLEENGYLDVHNGIEYAGSESMYITVLQFFLKSIDEKVTEIKDYYNNENWSDYRDKVHALKSSARAIGAEELSNRARSLELAANDGDYAYIREHTGEVMAFYSSYKGKLESIAN